MQSPLAVFLTSVLWLFYWSSSRVMFFVCFIIRLCLEPYQKRGLGSGSESNSDYYYYFVTLKKKRLRIDAYLLPQHATYNPVNRRIRDPYVRWCERRTSSERSGGAVYSISGSCFSVFYYNRSVERYISCHFSLGFEYGFQVC